MKKFTSPKFIIILVCFQLSNIFINAGNGIKSKQTDPSSMLQHINATPKLLGFEENKGQMRDTDGKATPFVLFRAHAPHLNLWVTTSGLTYQFQKESDDDDRKNDGEKNSEWHRVDMVLKNAEIKKENIITEGDITSRGDVAYYYGHCPNGIFNVRTYSKIIIKNIYRGIDWVLYAENGINGASIKQDFIVQPNADPNQIKLIYEGSGSFEMNNNQIKFSNKIGTLQEGKLYSYQGDQSNEVVSNYQVSKNNSMLNIGEGNYADEKEFNQTRTSLNENFSNEVSFQIGDYDKTQPLIIDPQLIWGTFMGGASEYEAITDLDCNMSTGDLFAVGYVGSPEFPIVTPVGSYSQVYATNRDGLILKFNSAGVALWTTFYGGERSDQFNGVDIDNVGDIIITGYSESTTFPCQDPGSGAFYDAVVGTSGVAGDDGIIVKFNSSGVRFWATYIGGNLDDIGYGVTTDANNNIFVTGHTQSSAFPIYNPGGSYSQSFNITTQMEAYVMKFSSTGVRLWGTFYGGSQWDYGHAICTDVSGNVYVTGYTTSSDFPRLNPGNGTYFDNTYSSSDAFLVKFDNNGVRLWATFIGGTSVDYGYSLIKDYANNLILAGQTSSLVGFPAANPGNNAYYVAASTGSSDAFIMKFNPNDSLIWGTTYGGTSVEKIGGSNGAFDVLAVDTCNNIFLSFNTQSVDIPTQNSTICASGFFDNTLGGTKDNFIVKFNDKGERLWATYVGGDGDDWREAIALDANMNLYMGGEWTSQGGTNPTGSTYPVANPGGGAFYNGTWNGGQDDVYLVKFSGLNPNLLQSSTNSGGCNGCSGTATVTVNCGDPSFTYIWSNGSQTINSSSATNTVTGLCPGSYTVTVTSGCGNTLTATFTIGGTFGISPTVTASGNITITCTSPTGTISANANPVSSTFSWAGPGIVSGQTSAVATVNAGGTYTVTATYQGCTQTATVTVIEDKVNPNVTTAGSNYQINCISSSDTITATSTTPGVTYSWSPSVVSGGTTSTPTVNQPGTYTVLVTNPANGCTNTATVTVTKDTIAPNLSTAPPATLNCAVTSTTINASSTVSPVNYNWSGPGIVSGGTTSSPTVNQPGVYTVIITNPANGCTNSTTVQVTQNIVTPNVTAGPGFTLTCTQTSGTISASSTTPGVTYSWTGGNVISGASSATATVNAAATYTITVTDPVNFCTNTATVIVNTDNSVPNVTSGNPLTLNCIILSGTINASSTTPGATFSWSGPGIVSGGNTTTPTVNQPGNYSVIVTDPGTGCTSVGAVLVILDNTPPTISATSSATITCTTTNDTITVTSTTSGVTYSWSGPSVVSGGTTSSPVIGASGTYTVLVTNPSNGCTNTTTVTVAIDTVAPLAISGSPGLLTCVVLSDTISASSNVINPTYSWSGSGIVSGATTSSPIINVPGTYTVIVTDPSNGCTKTTTVLVNQNITPPNVTTVGTATLTCVVTSLSISASSTTPNVSYSWSGPGIVSGATTASPTINTTGTYTVVVTNPVNGCTSTATVTVNNNLTPPNVTAGAGLTLHCNQTSGNISASSTVVGATYSWSGPGIVSGGTTNSPVVNLFGTYTVTVTDPTNGCTSTATVTVVNAPSPTASVTPSAGATILIGTSIQIFATGGPSYLWTPSTWLSCVTCADPIASPLDTITYCVTVTDQYGCQDSACVTINVYDPCPPINKDITMPNVFTPNSDGNNDLFYLKELNPECIAEFSMEIYDRWGLKMFESQNTNVVWDGRTASGLEVPAGTYYYVINIKRVRSEVKTYKGFVNLMR